jgi:hypothetical protein
VTDETYSVAEAPAATAGPPVAVSRVELILDNFRLTGNIRQAGVPRRLVDLMNNSDIEFFVMNDCRIDDPFRPEDPPRKLKSVEIFRESILFALPRGGDAPEHGDAFETVRKVPVPTTIVIPGFEVRGNAHFIPDVKPEDVPMMQNRHFVPLTDACISASGGRTATWNEPVAVVNLMQALLFAID